jgi:hypothetical protein
MPAVENRFHPQPKGSLMSAKTVRVSNKIVFV